jgi:hypothetical protein
MSEPWNGVLVQKRESINNDTTPVDNGIDKMLNSIAAKPSDTLLHVSRDVYESIKKEFKSSNDDRNDDGFNHEVIIHE